MDITSGQLNPESKKPHHTVAKFVAGIIVVVLIVGFVFTQRHITTFKEGQMCIKDQTVCTELQEKVSNEQNRCRNLLAENQQGTLADFNYCEEFLQWLAY